MISLLTNAHTHTTFCDGKNSAEEMVIAALQLGFTDIGFSGHSPVPYNLYDDAAMSEDSLTLYRNEINRLKEKYKDEINISTGLEIEYCSQINTVDIDYKIGALHWIYVSNTGKHYTFDDTHEQMQNAIQEGYGGKPLKLVEDYYRIVSEIPKKINPEIIAHFDLITKLNKNNRYFDEDSPKYKNLALEALEDLAKSNCIIEVNTGGMFRGYTETPYPAPFILKRLAELKHPIIISSDAHCTEALNFRFNESLELVKECGFSSIYVLRNNKFVEVGID